MDSLESALKLVKPNCFMASVDIRHAYYSVPMAPEHRKYLRFLWKGKVYEYSCLPNGIACASRQFTKLMKPVYASLHQMGHTNSSYIDDSLLLSDTFLECLKNINDTLSLMQKIGFIIHEKKSILTPVQNIVFLGNHIDSVKMIVYLTDERKEAIYLACKSLKNKEESSIRQAAHVIGLSVASFSAVELGPLFIQNLNRKNVLLLRKVKEISTQR